MVNGPCYLRVFVCVFCFCCVGACVCAPSLLPAQPSANMMVYRILGGVRTSDQANARACVRSRMHVVEFRNALRELRHIGGEY